MAKSQTLTTNIVINAHAGNGFSEIGNTLMELGSTVNQLSEQLINFGKESVETYRDYEKSMAETEVALATAYSGNSQGLKSAMDQLDTMATEWAASSIFHTDDVANAITEAARAGWDLEQITEGIPAAMELAQAGSIDLSEAVDYIVKSTNAAGISFDDLSSFIDMWAYSANSSATNIDEMGEAMIRMGRTMNFAGSTEEIFAMLSELANVGYTGQEAGTILRNAMLRLAAPTAKATEAMSDLQVTEEEMSEIMSDESVLAASEALETVGFSAYDSEGNLKNMVDIFSDLNEAFQGMSEQEVNSIMSAIFPSRTLAGGIALVEGAADSYNGLYDALKNGDAEGYGEYAAATMLDTLDGKIEIFDSKVERLKQVVGEALSDDVESVLGTLGGFIDDLANMDSDNLDALVSGLGAFALVGPGLMIAGSALKLLTNPISLVALGLAGIVGSVEYLEKVSEADFKNAFGDQDLDTEAMSQYISELGSAYDTAYSNVHKFSQELDASVESYQDASREFSSDLLTAMLTKTELTDEDIGKLEDLAGQMKTAVKDAIGFSADESAAFWETLFGVEHGDSITDDSDEGKAYRNIISTEASWYRSAVAEAESIGTGLTEAMNAAFADGELTPEERENIMSYVEDYNNTLVEAQKKWEDEQSRINLESLLWKSQNASWDSVQATAEEMTEQRDARVDELTNEYATERSKYSLDRENALESDTAFISPYIKQAYNQKTEDTLAAADKAFYQQIAATEAEYAEYGFNLFDSALKSSDMSDDYALALQLGSQLLNGGASAISSEQATGELYGTFRSQAIGNADQLYTALSTTVESLGGVEEILSQIQYLNENGQTDLASQIGSLLMAYGIVGQFEQFSSTGTEVANAYGQTESEVVNASQPVATITNGAGSSEYDNYYTPDYVVGGNINDEGTNEHTITAQVDGDTTELEEDIDELDGKQITEEVTQEVTQVDDSVYDEGFSIHRSSRKVKVQTEADNSGAEEDIDELNGTQVTAEVDGNTEPARSKISALNGISATIKIYADTSSATASLVTLQSLANSTVITKAFAEGGRATQASIFGEAGAEWAIPEEHSQRTADLLAQAATASGFTWPELLNLTGGLNASTNNSPTTLVYSPTINAGNAEGVASALKKDKDNLLKLLAEQNMLKEVEAYA